MQIFYKSLLSLVTTTLREVNVLFHAIIYRRSACDVGTWELSIRRNYIVELTLTHRRKVKILHRNSFLGSCNRLLANRILGCTTSHNVLLEGTVLFVLFKAITKELSSFEFYLRKVLYVSEVQCRQRMSVVLWKRNSQTCFLLPPCEVLRACRSGPPIATESSNTAVSLTFLSTARRAFLQRADILLYVNMSGLIHKQENFVESLFKTWVLCLSLSPLTMRGRELFVFTTRNWHEKSKALLWSRTETLAEQWVCSDSEKQLNFYPNVKREKCKLPSRAYNKTNRW